MHDPNAGPGRIRAAHQPVDRDHQEDHKAQVMDPPPRRMTDAPPDIERERHQREQIQARLPPPHPERPVVHAKVKSSLWASGSYRANPPARSPARRAFHRVDAAP